MTVKGESKNRIAKIRNEVEDEMLRVISQIQRRRFIAGVVSITDLGWVVSLGKRGRLEPLLNAVAKDVESKVLFPEQLLESLREGLNTYLADSFRYEEGIMKRINQHDIFPWVRRRQYPEERTKLSTKVKNSYDIEILLDAHDLSLGKALNALEFVTGDLVDIISNKEAILSVLHLSVIRSLSSF